MSSRISPKKNRKEVEKEKRITPESLGFKRLGENLSYLQKLALFEVALILGCTVASLLAYKDGANVMLLVTFFIMLCTVILAVGLVIYAVKSQRNRNSKSKSKGV